jgi:hypothetical protein
MSPSVLRFGGGTFYETFVGICPVIPRELAGGLHQEDADFEGWCQDPSRVFGITAPLFSRGENRAEVVVVDQVIVANTFLGKILYIRVCSLILNGEGQEEAYSNPRASARETRGTPFLSMDFQPSPEGPP